MGTRPERQGHVARLITDDELIVNLGSNDGMKSDMYFNILDTSTENIKDPITGEDLGSIERVKAQIRIVRVAERISLGRIYPGRGRGGLSVGIETLMGPKPPSGKLTGDSWPDGVRVGDPIKYVTGPKE
jgi:hypothetical protein